jgi:hypothetical protein
VHNSADFGLIFAPHTQSTIPPHCFCDKTPPIVLASPDQSVSRMNGSLESNCGYARTGDVSSACFKWR